MGCGKVVFDPVRDLEITEIPVMMSSGCKKGDNNNEDFNLRKE